MIGKTYHGGAALVVQNIRVCEYVKAIMDHGTMRRAAESLFVSESSISQTLHLFERELGFQLFERTGRKLTLTREGDRLLPYLTHILEAAETFSDVIRDIQNPLQGTLKLGIVPSLALTILSDIITTLKARLPGVILEVHEGGSVEILRDIMSQKLDIGLVATPPSRHAGISTEGLVIHNLFSSTLEPVVSNRHPLARKRTISTFELSRQSLVLFRPGYIVRDIVLSALPPESKPAIMYSADNTESLRNMIRLGSGVCLLPTFLLNHWSEHELLGLHRLSEARSLFPVKQVAAYRASRFVPSYFTDFINVVQSIVDRRELLHG